MRPARWGSGFLRSGIDPGAASTVCFAAPPFAVFGFAKRSLRSHTRINPSAQPSDVATDRNTSVFLRGVFGPDSATVGTIPADVVQAILWTVVHFFENRSPVVTGTIATELPNGIQNILRPYRQNLI